MVRIDRLQSESLSIEPIERSKRLFNRKERDLYIGSFPKRLVLAFEYKSTDITPRGSWPHAQKYRLLRFPNREVLVDGYYEKYHGPVFIVIILKEITVQGRKSAISLGEGRVLKCAFLLPNGSSNKKAKEMFLSMYNQE